jgi:hypothetical protein
VVLVIPAEAPIGPEPTECAFNDPPLRKRLEPSGFLFSAHDSEEPVKTPPDEPAWEALVPTVGKYRLQSGHLSQNPFQQKGGHLTVVFVCWMNKYAKEKSDRIDNYMPFPALDLLAWVWSPARTSLPSGIDGLGIDNRRAGAGIASLSHAGRTPNSVTKPLEEVQPTPLPEMVVGSPPGRKLLREHPPLAATFEQIKHRVQQLTRIMVVKPEAIKNGLDAFPFCVGQVRGIARVHRSEVVL